MRAEKEKRYLPCPLTREEVERFADLMADAENKRQIEVAAAKRDASMHRSAIQLFEGRIAELADKVSSKIEHRYIECRIEYDSKKLEKSFIRTDTGEIVGTEPMTDSERQEEMKMETGAPKQKKKAGDKK